MRRLNPDDQAEFDELLRDAVGDPSNGGKVAREKAVALELLLLDAEQAGRDWATAVLDEARLEGLMKVCKDWMKRKATVLVSYDGKVVGKSVRVGVRRRDEAGREVWQQTLMHDMTWDELEAHLAMIRDAISGYLVSQDMAKRLLRLREQFPDSVGPREACSRLGLTIEEFLEQAS